MRKYKDEVINEGNDTQINQNNYSKNISDSNSLSESEQKEVKKFLDWGIKPEERLIIHKVTRKIDRVDPKEWAKIKNKSEELNWIILVNSSH